MHRYLLVFAFAWSCAAPPGGETVNSNNPDLVDAGSNASVDDVATNSCTPSCDGRACGDEYLR